MEFDNTLELELSDSLDSIPDDSDFVENAMREADPRFKFWLEADSSGAPLQPGARKGSVDSDYTMASSLPATRRGTMADEEVPQASVSDDSVAAWLAQGTRLSMQLEESMAKSCTLSQPLQSPHHSRRARKTSEAVPTPDDATCTAHAELRSLRFGELQERCRALGVDELDVVMAADKQDLIEMISKATDRAVTPTVAHLERELTRLSRELARRDRLVESQEARCIQLEARVEHLQREKDGQCTELTARIQELEHRERCQKELQLMEDDCLQSPYSKVDLIEEIASRNQALTAAQLELLELKSAPAPSADPPKGILKKRHPMASSPRHSPRSPVAARAARNKTRNRWSADDLSRSCEDLRRSPAHAWQGTESPQNPSPRSSHKAAGRVASAATLQKQSRGVRGATMETLLPYSDQMRVDAEAEAQRKLSKLSQAYSAGMPSAMSQCRAKGTAFTTALTELLDQLLLPLELLREEDEGAVTAMVSQSREMLSKTFRGTMSWIDALGAVLNTQSGVVPDCHQAAVKELASSRAKVENALAKATKGKPQAKVDELKVQLELANMRKEYECQRHTLACNLSGDYSKVTLQSFSRLFQACETGALWRAPG
eukprot:TRINITY_DN2155_c0_g2_i5.p1 TRINITY_DN2155_c0_g2~~TRINITY_DN2155_c0_g2_i5.p1  ORF type:complete len:605 (-),score=151.70 TRINITY_DN2155_c0_g2_i5:1176-2990(-)